MNRHFVFILSLLTLILFTTAVGCSIENKLKERPDIKTAEEDGPLIYDHGIYNVNVDIEPGRYRSQGVVEFFNILSCIEGSLIERWPEYILTEDELDCVIRLVSPMERSFVIDICSSDFAFETSGDGNWILIDESYQPEIKTIFSEGHWIVGLEIKPGTYHTKDDVFYWSRLSGFRDDFEDLIYEEFVDPAISIDEEGITVVIEPGDVGFYSISLDGKSITWEMVD